jgi:hypothetical protein
MRFTEARMRQLFQFIRLQYIRSSGMIVIAIALIATNAGNLQGDDASRLSAQTSEVLRALDAELWGQESLDDEGNVLRVCIDCPNGERLEKLVRTFPMLKLIFFRKLDESLAPEDIRCLDGLPNLTSIWFLSPLTDRWAEAFSRLQKLQELHLIIRVGVTERGLAALAALKEVETLSLIIGYDAFRAAEDEHGAAVLRQFPNVKRLTLSGSSVSRQTLKEVGQHQPLRVLRCGSARARLKEGDYAPLAQLKHLEEVEVPAVAVKSIAPLHSLKRVYGLSNIDDEGMRHISELRNLEELRLPSANQLTDQSLVHLKNATALTTLELRGLRLDGSGLVHLARCKQLRRLVLRQTNFQPNNAGHLTAFSALEYLDLGWTPMSDGENWQALATLKVLGNLKEVQVELSEPDRLRLGEMLPGVLVNYLE